MDTTVVQVFNPLDPAFLGSLLLGLALFASEVLPHINVKANSLFQLTILPVVNAILKSLGRDPVGATKGLPSRTAAMAPVVED